MRSTFAGLALVAAVAASPVPQSSSGCVTTYPGTFEIQVVNATSSKVKRQAIVLSISLQDGGLTDSEGRIGYIASNKQFQFDAGQPQAGAEGINSFSVCGDLLAHSGVTTWDACKSGGFSNLYSDNSIAAGNPGQCTEVNIQVIPSSGDTTTAAATSAATSAAATEITDGQPQATVATAAATQITDGQVQATVAPATQITDGQVQATVAPATQITDGQVQATVAPATQITDGQVQATVAPATQITDGQVQATVVASTGVAPYPGANTTVAGSAPSVVPATGAAGSFTMGSSIVGLVAAVAALAMF